MLKMISAKIMSHANDGEWVFRTREFAGWDNLTFQNCRKTSSDYLSSSSAYYTHNLDQKRRISTMAKKIPIRESNIPLSQFGVLVAQLQSIVASAAHKSPDPLLCFDLLSDLISAITDEPKVLFSISSIA